MRKICRILTMMCAVFFCSMTVLAGDINSAEQSIVSTVCGTYEYMGSYYKVKDEYISQVISYLSRDNVNLTEGQASSYISQFYSNIGAGVSGGYMYKVGDVEAEPTTEPTTESTPGQEPTQAPQQSASETETESEITETYEVNTFEARDMYVWDIDRLKVYEEADETSAFIGLVFKGDCVSVTGTTTNGWMQVMHNGETGYVDAKYLRTYEYMVEIGEIVEEETDSSEMASSEITSTEVTSTESVSTEGDTSETVTTESESNEAGYDYSDATPLQKNMSMGLIAIVVCVVVAIAGIIIVWVHKKKNFKR